MLSIYKYSFQFDLLLNNIYELMTHVVLLIEINLIMCDMLNNRISLNKIWFPVGFYTIYKAQLHVVYTSIYLEGGVKNMVLNLLVHYRPYYYIRRYRSTSHKCW